MILVKLVMHCGVWVFGLKQKMQSFCGQNFNYVSTVSGVCFFNIKSSDGNFSVTAGNCYSKDHKDRNVGGFFILGREKYSHLM